VIEFGKSVFDMSIKTGGANRPLARISGRALLVPAKRELWWSSEWEEIDGS
jgi:hypothetical protein